MFATENGTLKISSTPKNSFIMFYAAINYYMNYCCIKYYKGTLGVDKIFYVQFSVQALSVKTIGALSEQASMPKNYVDEHTIETHD